MPSVIDARFERRTELTTFVKALLGGVEKAAAAGLNEHTHEQRRQSVVRMTRITGIPGGRISGVTKVKPASPGPSMEAHVVVKDKPIGIHEYGNPRWVRDMKPRHTAYGPRGRVSSMAGAEATGWNRRKVFPHTFIGGGKVLFRSKSSGKLKQVWGPVLANELVDPKKSNAPAAEAYLSLDLTNRVLRHIGLSMGI